MRRIRLFEIFGAVLLAWFVVAGGAYAHGPSPEANQVSQVFQPPNTTAGDTGSSDSLRDHAPQLMAAADNLPPSSHCTGESSAECCSHHCCTGTPAVSESRSPALVTGTRLVQSPPDAPREQALSGLLRPPCR